MPCQPRRRLRLATLPRRVAAGTCGCELAKPWRLHDAQNALCRQPHCRKRVRPGGQTPHDRHHVPVERQVDAHVPQVPPLRRASAAASQPAHCPQRAWSSSLYLFRMKGSAKCASSFDSMMRSNSETCGQRSAWHGRCAGGWHEPGSARSAASRTPPPGTRTAASCSS